ncbi:hypothetical protein [bacterium endosymbiont of Bathymodiolus sp. 5 South]|jgi:hypothetical protein|uniref:hypothetical protein n=1 Tax=bacterium endosymbiont of Bathymodiolus sp. 5 South TaxID=1181670 RepID=UPI0010B5BABF|nr:hypothetical protein [bacterium endosymbiont of Bathymodiolus sp. 5 South]CAC9656120.1 hypothetical protein [uncultured Gammaproteobacteria bacterium]CAC9658012.1 hypothetical protein [uncultured Gammaproteobacteria bacterium]CAC9658813.1 hypothetical protein [uncultured Gammaproteobacteria bacterium]SHN92694.1 hypothetical protein BCLUESOX_2721 [bacterium endosymbiont of Bathymodiolus sp. 5 South]SSC09291.1 hypothetical protein BTURTLESOX_2065 [bacterium endosymbiont of Bathymodiolus sp. 5
MKLHTLGLLALSSFNVLGSECIIKASDKSTYTIKSSIYSYPNNINICKCQAGYEFSPFISREELSKNGKQENSFMVSLDLAGKKFQCVIPKDNTKPSTAAWVIPVSLFYAIAGGLVICHRTFKIKPRLPGLLGDEPPGLLGDTPNVIENDYQPLPVNWDNVSTSSTEYENISLNLISGNTPINAHDALDNQIQDILSEEHIDVNAQNVLPDNEVADSSRGLISGTRSPAPERIYDEISNNTNLNSRTQCNIQ